MAAAPQRWEAVKTLFEQALSLTPEERILFLRGQAAIEPDVLEEVKRLLAEHGDLGSGFLSVPVLADVPTPDVPIPGVPPSPRLHEGDLLSGRFRIVHFIAAGGMGEVYEAEDLELRERVALKTIRHDVLNRPDALTRFKREIHFARKVTHPNVCRVFDLFRHTLPQGEEIVFVSMELLSGMTLSRRLREHGRMGLVEAQSFALQMAAALSAAHDAGIVHRDFKPGNVMLVSGDGPQTITRVVVTDFGLALRFARPVISPSSTTLSLTSDCSGTPAYMSPEQIEGRMPTAASDIYSLGLVLYEMVTGERPFQGETPVLAALKRLSDPPTPPRRFLPDISPAWERTILRCLERDPAKRFANVQDVVAELRGERGASDAGKPLVETQARVLEAAAPKESRVGKSTEVMALVRCLDSRGLRGCLADEDEATPAFSPDDVRERRFELDFALDESGKPKPAEILLRLESPDFEPRSQTKKVRVAPQGDSSPQTFLITPRITGELVVNLELLTGDEIIVSRPIRLLATDASAAISNQKSIVSVPLTILIPVEPAPGKKKSSAKKSPAIPRFLKASGLGVFVLALVIAAAVFVIRPSKNSAGDGQAGLGPKQPPVVQENPPDLRTFGPGTSQVDGIAIEATLNRYRQAYEGKNLTGIEEVWPSIPEAELNALRDKFEQYDRVALSLSLDKDAIEVNGNSAVVHARQVAGFFSKGNVALETTSKLELKLAKMRSGTWVIQSVSSK